MFAAVGEVSAGAGDAYGRDRNYLGTRRIVVPLRNQTSVVVR